MVDGVFEHCAKGQAEYPQGNRNPRPFSCALAVSAVPNNCVVVEARRRRERVSTEDLACSHKKPWCKQTNPRRGMQACSVCCHKRASVETR